MAYPKWFVRVRGNNNGLRSPMEYQPVSWQGWTILLLVIFVMGVIMVVIFEANINPVLAVLLILLTLSPIYAMYLLLASRYS